MVRTQISLSDEDRQVLAAASSRTGRSMSALIRDAVQRVYGTRSTVEDDLAALESATGAWRDREQDGEEYVASLRSARRLSPS